MGACLGRKKFDLDRAVQFAVFARKTDVPGVNTSWKYRRALPLCLVDGM